MWGRGLAGQGTLSTRGDLGGSSPGTSEWVLWDALEVTKAERKAELAGLRSTTFFNYRTLFFDFVCWGSCTAPPVMRVLLLDKA